MLEHFLVHIINHAFILWHLEVLSQLIVGLTVGVKVHLGRLLELLPRLVLLLAPASGFLRPLLEESRFCALNLLLLEHLLSTKFVHSHSFLVNLLLIKVQVVKCHVSVTETLLGELFLHPRGVSLLFRAELPPRRWLRGLISLLLRLNLAILININLRISLLHRFSHLIFAFNYTIKERIVELL